jgi:hypothetical protein
MSTEQIQRIENSKQFTGYYYNDNWTGLRLEFKYLSTALISAQKEYGHNIEIKFSHNGELAILVNASGFCPA